MLCKAISKCHGTNDTAISTIEQDIAKCPPWNKTHWDTHYRTKQCTPQYPLHNKPMHHKIPTAQQNNAPQNTLCTTKQCSPEYPLHNKTMHPRIPSAQQNNAPQNTLCTTKQCTPEYPLHNKTMLPRIPSAQQNNAPQNTLCTTKQCSPEYTLHNKTMLPRIPIAEQQTPQYPLHHKSHPNTRCRIKHTLQQKKTGRKDTAIPRLKKTGLQHP